MKTYVMRPSYRHVCRRVYDGRYNSREEISETLCGMPVSPTERRYVGLFEVPPAIPLCGDCYERLNKGER
jgi:hypothetical protein